MSMNRARYLAMASLWMAAAISMAEPVLRQEAYRAARSELPGFFPGPWKSTGEIVLKDLEGSAAAYLFMFKSTGTDVVPISDDSTPAEYVARTRARLKLTGNAVSGSTRALYGEDRFASIVISADDEEPIVLRCFKGLSPHLVKEADAVSLAARKGGGGTWRVREYLMLGLFDEAFSIETDADGSTLVVDTRTGTVLTHSEAKTRAIEKQREKRSNSELRGRCRQAWRAYRSPNETHVLPAVLPAAATARRTKKVAATVQADPILEPGEGE